MDTCFAYGQNPSLPARALSRSPRSGIARLDRAGHLRVQRPLQPAALRQHLAAPGAKAAPADLDSGRRLGRDLAVVRPDGLRLLLSLVLRLQGRAGDDERVLGRDGAARQGPEPVSRRLSAVRRGRRDPRGGVSALPRAGRIFLWPLPACRPALRRAARLCDRGTQRRGIQGQVALAAQPRATSRKSRCWPAKWMRSSTRAM